MQDNIRAVAKLAAAREAADSLSAFTKKVLDYGLDIGFADEMEEWLDWYAEGSNAIAKHEALSDDAPALDSLENTRTD